MGLRKRNMHDGLHLGWQGFDEGVYPSDVSAHGNDIKSHYSRQADFMDVQELV